MTRWEAMHRYKRLAREGQVAPLACPDDGVAFITRLGRDDVPVLYCYLCRTTVTPGISLYKQMEAALGEKIEETP